MGWKRRLALGAGGVGATVLAARTATHRAATELRTRVDPELDHLYQLPDGVEHRDIATFDGGSLHVIEKGEGRPLLLIHGITLQASIWAPLFHLLADRYRVVAIDVRGHGQSKAGECGMGRAHAAHDLATVLDHLDLREAVVMGHSMGGMITMEFCGNHPDVLDARVAGLVFMDTAAHQVMPSLVKPVAAFLGQRMVTRLQAGRRVPEWRVADDDLSWLTTRLAFGARPSAAAVDQVRQMLVDVPQATTLPSGVDLLDHDAREALAATDTPSMVLVGSRDLLTPPFAARRICRFLPQSELHVLPDAGHQLMQERPVEVVELLDRFVDRLPPAAGVRVAS